MTEIEKFIEEWIDGQCRKFQAELNNMEQYEVPLNDETTGGDAK